MKRRATPYAIDAYCCSSSHSDARHNIKQFLKSYLFQIGLRSGIDFIVTTTHLRIRHIKDVVGRILVVLREMFPVFNFYWQTSRMLVWF